MAKTTKLIFINREDTEWNYMFSFFPDTVMRNDQYLESLQYVGTVMDMNTGNVWHEFRHRAVPVTNERKYWKIDASLNFLLRKEEMFADVQPMTFTY